MPAVSRVGVDTATDGQGTGIILGPGVATVLVNGSIVSVIGDGIAAHGTHPADTIITGSTTVFAGSVGVVRAGDTTSGGGSVDSGSANVIAG